MKWTESALEKDGQFVGEWEVTATNETMDFSNEKLFEKTGIDHKQRCEKLTDSAIEIFESDLSTDLNYIFAIFGFLSGGLAIQLNRKNQN